MHGRGRAEVRVLALIYALGGLLCLASARWPLDARSPVVLSAVLGCVGLLLAVLALVVGRRRPAPVVHVGLALLSALVGLIAAASVTAVGVVGLGPAVIAASVFAAHAFTPSAGRAHVLALTALATTGAIVSPADVGVVVWAIVPLTAITVFEVHSALVGRLRAAAGVDPLTGVANRRSWEEAAARHLAQAQRSRQPFSVLIIDLDDFKLVNDGQGHAAGDALLRELAARWGGALRRGDLLGRYGGDEFVVSLPGADRVAAVEAVVRLRASHPTAWSVGIAHADDEGTLDELLVRADRDLYEHKRRRATPLPHPRPAT